MARSIGRAPLLWLVLPVGAGIALADALPALPIRPTYSVAAALALVAAWTATQASRFAPALWALLVAASAMFLGMARAQTAARRLDGWADRPPREIMLELRVVRMFATSPRNRMRYGLGRIESAPPHAPELHGLQVYFSTIRRADVAPPQPNGSYRISGVIVPLPRRAQPAGFEDYLRDLGIAAKFQRGHVVAEVQAPGPASRWAARARDDFSAMLSHGLDRHPILAALQVAMMLGEKAEMPPDREAAFMRSGTYHIFSVSGLHVVAVAGAIQSMLLLIRVPRTVRIIVGLAALWFYILVVGAQPPAVRAYIMVAFLLAQGLWGLPGKPLAALAAAALTTLLIDPRQLFGSGFQLSYTVVTALVVLGGPMSDRWLAAWRPWVDLPEITWRPWQKAFRWVGRKCLSAFAATLAALVGSTPATIAAFGLFTPGGLVANLVIVPLASLALGAGFLSILGGCLGLSGLCLVFNHAAAVVIIVMEKLAGWSTAVPLTHFPAAFRAAWLTAPAMVLPLALMLVGAARRWRGWGGFWLPFAGVGLVLLACVRLG